MGDGDGRSFKKSSYLFLGFQMGPWREWEREGEKRKERGERYKKEKK